MEHFDHVEESTLQTELFKYRKEDGIIGLFDHTRECLIEFYHHCSIVNIDDVQVYLTAAVYLEANVFHDIMLKYIMSARMMSDIAKSWIDAEQKRSFEGKFKKDEAGRTLLLVLPDHQVNDVALASYYSVLEYFAAKSLEGYDENMQIKAMEGLEREITFSFYDCSKISKLGEINSITEQDGDKAFELVPDAFAEKQKDKEAETQAENEVDALVKEDGTADCTCLKPLELFSELSKYVFAQEETLSQICVAMGVQDYRRKNKIIAETTQVMLLVGNSGSGKTYIFDVLRKFGYPVHVVDATQLTICGYQGDDVSGIFRNLMDYNLVFVDEMSAS